MIRESFISARIRFSLDNERINGDRKPTCTRWPEEFAKIVPSGLEKKSPYLSRDFEESEVAERRPRGIRRNWRRFAGYADIADGCEHIIATQLVTL